MPRIQTLKLVCLAITLPSLVNADSDLGCMHLERVKFTLQEAGPLTDTLVMPLRMLESDENHSPQCTLTNATQISCKWTFGHNRAEARRTFDGIAETLTRCAQFWHTDRFSLARLIPFRTQTYRLSNTAFALYREHIGYPRHTFVVLDMTLDDRR